MDESIIAGLFQRARAGDQSAVGALLEAHRERLQRMVALRLDRRLRGRLDESDVLHDAFLQTTRRLGDYLQRPAMPF